MTWAATGRCHMHDIELCSYHPKVIWCYDYVLVLDREIENVWYAAWSLNKALYFGYRYPGLVSAVIVCLTTPALSWQTVEVWNT